MIGLFFLTHHSGRRLTNTAQTPSISSHTALDNETLISSAERLCWREIVFSPVLVNHLPAHHYSAALRVCMCACGECGVWASEQCESFPVCLSENALSAAEPACRCAETLPHSRSGLEQR